VTFLAQHVGEAHLDGAGQDVVLHDLCAKALILEQAVKIKAELLQSGVDGVVGGQEHGDPVDLIAQDVCGLQSHLILCNKISDKEVYSRGLSVPAGCREWAVFALCAFR
jgi:hypothetical protein